MNYREIGFHFAITYKMLPSTDSDIDLALIFTNLDDSKRFEIQVQLMLLAAKIDSRIEPHPLSQDEFNSGNPFVVKIKKPGIKLAA